MSNRIAHLVDPQEAETLDVLGPTIAFLTAPEEGTPCVMRGTIPPGGVVPLHSHADPETFLMLEGEIEGLVISPDGHRWVRVAPGEVFHVPGDVPHAWRNASRAAAVMHLVSTARIGFFFREVGTPVNGTRRRRRTTISANSRRRPSGTGTGTPPPR